MPARSIDHDSNNFWKALYVCPPPKWSGQRACKSSMLTPQRSFYPELRPANVRLHFCHLWNNWKLPRSITERLRMKEMMCRYPSRSPSSILKLFLWAKNTNKIFSASGTYNDGCWLTNMVHWRISPLHWGGLPSYFSRNAKWGLAVVVCPGVDKIEALVWGATFSDGVTWSDCSVFTTSSVKEVSLWSWCWWVASCEAWADSSEYRSLLDCVLMKSSLTRHHYGWDPSAALFESWSYGFNIWLNHNKKAE